MRPVDSTACDNLERRPYPSFPAAQQARIKHQEAGRSRLLSRHQQYQMRSIRVLLCSWAPQGWLHGPGGRQWLRMGGREAAMIVASPALPHQSAIRIPQINANQSYVPDWDFPSCCQRPCSALAYWAGLFFLVFSSSSILAHPQSSASHKGVDARHRGRPLQAARTQSTPSAQSWCCSGILRMHSLASRGPQSWPGRTTLPTSPSVCFVLLQLKAARYHNTVASRRRPLSAIRPLGPGQARRSLL